MKGLFGRVRAAFGLEGFLFLPALLLSTMTVQWSVLVLILLSVLVVESDTPSNDLFKYRLCGEGKVRDRDRKLSGGSSEMRGRRRHGSALGSLVFGTCALPVFFSDLADETYVGYFIQVACMLCGVQALVMCYSNVFVKPLYNTVCMPMITAVVFSVSTGVPALPLVLLAQTHFFLQMAIFHRHLSKGAFSFAEGGIVSALCAVGYTCAALLSHTCETAACLFLSTMVTYLGHLAALALFHGRLVPLVFHEWRVQGAMQVLQERVLRLKGDISDAVQAKWRREDAEGLPCSNDLSFLLPKHGATESNAASGSAQAGLSFGGGRHAHGGERKASDDRDKGTVGGGMSGFASSRGGGRSVSSQQGFPSPHWGSAGRGKKGSQTGGRSGSGVGVGGMSSSPQAGVSSSSVTGGSSHHHPLGELSSSVGLNSSSSSVPVSTSLSSAEMAYKRLNHQSHMTGVSDYRLLLAVDPESAEFYASVSRLIGEQDEYLETTDNRYGNSKPFRLLSFLCIPLAVWTFLDAVLWVFSGPFLFYGNRTVLGWFFWFCSIRRGIFVFWGLSLPAGLSLVYLLALREGGSSALSFSSEPGKGGITRKDSAGGGHGGGQQGGGRNSNPHRKGSTSRHGGQGEKEKESHHLQSDLDKERDRGLGDRSNELRAPQGYMPPTKSALIVVRKLYHFLLTWLLFPVLMLGGQLDFLSVACVGALVLFCLVEYVRLSGIFGASVSKQINQFVDLFIDERDRAGVIVTHTYLLLGTALPIFLETLAPSTKTGLLRASLGLLTNIGDAFASLFGVFVGGPLVVPWGSKTWTGVFAFILSSAVCAYSLELCPDPLSIFVLIVTLILTSLFEGATSDIDNLSVPIFATVTYRTLEDALAELILFAQAA
uniref:dolichol kinase n=1 Tax=Chromera velia CCMP2878 TaxID=1169474 RepID=A0A0K6SB01_9ALVE|eukprot:Cvel_1999.t1-p1 / transcript=Cvel_1999.t1 / gene=Cvel_1999 / organism=Chromera_velia_CCMP2878 / gene_product=Dolichol kinase sec59, putative / transcript_product=Dolichol kinase sec59, putative / location=Cvel_scaffold76:72292-81626(-) / protein_length=882 / sequence_SO=supercontig / SO=protein_coding / is_pseudo=false